MTCYSDIIIDVSTKLTFWWSEHKTVGDNWFYDEFPELFNPNIPATLKDVIELSKAKHSQVRVLMIESISCGLYEVLVEDGFYD